MAVWEACVNCEAKVELVLGDDGVWHKLHPIEHKENCGSTAKC